MSEQRLNLVPTETLVRAMIALEGNEDFVALMLLMKDRSEGLSLWSSLVENDVKLRWAQGRVQEMNDWLQLWDGRREFKRQLELLQTAREVDGF